MVWFRGMEARMRAAPLRPEDAPTSIYGSDGKPQFFGDPAMDRFVSVLLNIASELWVQAERIDTLTAVIDRNGLTTADGILQIVREDDTKREANLRDFIVRVLAPLREASA